MRETTKALQPLISSTMENLQMSNQPPDSQYADANQFTGDFCWDSHSRSFDNCEREQHAARTGNENARSMLHFQGSSRPSNQESFQNLSSIAACPDGLDEPPKRRGRTSKNAGPERPQKRKRMASEVSICDNGEWARCYEDCTSEAGSLDTCCSSCSDGLPCEDPFCAIPCAESSCEKPICPEDCPLVNGAPVQQMNFQQVLTQSSERFSFLQQPDAEPWNMARSREALSFTKVENDRCIDCIDPSFPSPEVNSQHPPQQGTSSPTTPHMAQNIASPYSPEEALQTPRSTGQASQISYPNETSILVGAGGMFNTSIDDWDANSFKNAGQNPWMFNCPWDACNKSISDAQFWMQHLHQAHLDPQYTYGCPLQSNECPSILGANPLNHLQTQHGFNMNENYFSCPAPTCSPAEIYNDPALFHNHFDQAHAIPAQGFLNCRLDSCNGSFVDQNQLLSHINESHQLPVSHAKNVAKSFPQIEAANYPPAISDNQALATHTCKWKLQNGSNCGETCDTEKDLQDHVKVKHLAILSKKTGYICQWENCSRPAKMGAKQGFSQRGKLERHMASHSNFKCSECDICHQMFSAEQAMKQHRLLHTGEKPWKCKYCDKRFPQQSACTIHERTHTKDKPLECEVCGKKFSESSNFAKHRRIHGELGEHACKVQGCGKTFHRSDQLKKHMKVHNKHQVGFSSGNVDIETISSDDGSDEESTGGSP